MKADGCVHKSTVSQSWAKGTCPFRRVPKEFQSASADQIQIAADVRLCNFHTWLLARGAPAKQVAAFYLKMLDGPPVVGASSWECDFCRRIIQEENVRLRELVQQMPRALFLDWMKSQMNLCLDHPHKLQQSTLEDATGDHGESTPAVSS